MPVNGGMSVTLTYFGSRCSWARWPGTETGPRGGASRKSEDFFRLTGESVRSKRVSVSNDEVVVPNVPGRSQAEKIGGQLWLMLAFPGDAGGGALQGFARSAAGTSWYRTLATRDQAIACKRGLVAAGIRYTCKKIARPRRQFGKRPPKGGFGGRLNAAPIKGSWRRKVRHK